MMSLLFCVRLLIFPLRKFLYFGVLFSMLAGFSAGSHSEPLIHIELSSPALEVDPYHRPYVAIWLETSEREAVATLALWHEDKQWLKDLRQWWRKVGRRAGPELDAVTGATRRPGVHTISWDGKNDKGQLLGAGEYLLNIEASREEGGRTYIRKKITFNQPTEIRIPAKNEFGDIHVTINKMQF